MNKKIQFIKDNFSFLLMNFGIVHFIKICCEHILSINYYFIMKYNLKLLKLESSSLSLTGDLSLMSKDNLTWLKENITHYDPDDRREIISRINFYEYGFKHCYVIKNEEEIVYIQWLITPEDNDILRKHFKREFLALNKNQVMLEKAFTFPKYRGRGYLFYGSQYLLDIAKKMGYKSVVVYIKNDTINSINGFFHLGFKVFKFLREIKFFGFVYRDI